MKKEVVFTKMSMLQIASWLCNQKDEDFENIDLRDLRYMYQRLYYTPPMYSLTRDDLIRLLCNRATTLIPVA
jgi:hypothetical protein